MISVHGTHLSIGKRVVNANMDLQLVNLKLLGAKLGDLTRLPDYSRLASSSCGVPIAPSYPVLGEDAFRTGTGVHAAAIVKARKKGHAWLADRIYSGVPAGDFGLGQRIDISPVSGLSNVRCWLEEHGYDATDDALCQRIFDAAKRMNRVIRDDELHAMIDERKRQPARA